MHDFESQSDPTSVLNKIKHVDCILSVAIWYGGWNCKESRIVSAGTDPHTSWINTERAATRQHYFNVSNERMISGEWVNF